MPEEISRIYLNTLGSIGYRLTQILLLFARALLNTIYIRKQTALLCLSDFPHFERLCLTVQFSSFHCKHSLSFYDTEKVSGSQYHTARASKAKANISKPSPKTPSCLMNTNKESWKKDNQKKTNEPL